VKPSDEGSPDQHWWRYLARRKVSAKTSPPQLTLMLSDVVVSYLMAMPKPLWQQFNHQGLEHLRRTGVATRLRLATLGDRKRSDKQRPSVVNSKSKQINRMRQPNEPTHHAATIRSGNA
jgi:hypothetical protein